MKQEDFQKLAELLAEIYLDWVQIELVRIGLQRSNIIKAARTEVDMKTLSVALYLPDYEMWIQQGRRPGGKRPPLDVILKWVIRKMGSQNANKKAWAISTAIARRGIRARPFVERAQRNALEEAEGKIPNLLLEVVDFDLRHIFTKKP